MAVVLAGAVAVLAMQVAPAGWQKLLPCQLTPPPPLSPVSILLLLFYDDAVKVVTLLFLYLYNILVFVHVIGK